MVFIFDSFQTTEHTLNSYVASLPDKRSSLLGFSKKSPSGKRDVDDTRDTNTGFTFQRANVLFDKNLECDAVNRALNTVNSTTRKDIRRGAGIDCFRVSVGIGVWNDTPERDELLLGSERDDHDCRYRG